MGHLSERADKFAAKYATPKVEEVSQIEKETAFAKDFMTAKGLREQWQRVREMSDAGK